MRFVHLLRLSRSDAYTRAASGFSLAYGVPLTNISIEDLP